jgi:hypothetical protein
MNIIGKIFVFAVFVMSLVFMSFAIALFSTHTNWRDEITRTADQVQAGKPLGYKLQLEEARKERETLTAEIAKLTAEVAASEAARDQVVAKIHTALEAKDTELQDLRKDKDAREDEREKAQSELALARAELEKATKTVEDLRADIAKQQNTVNDAVARSAKLAGELHEKAGVGGPRDDEVERDARAPGQREMPLVEEVAGGGPVLGKDRRRDRGLLQRLEEEEGHLARRLNRLGANRGLRHDSERSLRSAQQPDEVGVGGIAEVVQPVAAVERPRRGL